MTPINKIIKNKEKELLKIFIDYLLRIRRERYAS